MKKVYLIFLLSLLVIFAICCSKKNKSMNPGTQNPDFAIQVTPRTQWVMAGKSTEYKVRLTSLNGLSAPCTLSVVNFPEGDSVAFVPKVLVPTDSSRLIIYTTFSTSRNIYALVITGKNGEISHSDTAILVIPLGKVTDYYPLAIGNSWTYAWLDQNGRIWDTFSYNIIDTATTNGNFGYLFSGIIFVYVKGDTIFDKSGGIILAGPLVIGQSWPQGQFTYQLIGFEEATLKSDTTRYPNCIKFRKTFPAHPEDEAFEWWAKDVGLVKYEEYISGQYQGSRELVSAFIIKPGRNLK